MVSATISLHYNPEHGHAQSPGANYRRCPLSLTLPAFDIRNTPLSHPLSWTALCETRSLLCLSALVPSFSLSQQLYLRKWPELLPFTSFETDKMPVRQAFTPYIRSPPSSR
jgi:hypothetical protein